MRIRRLTQVAGVFAANPWFAYLGSRTIYQGSAKGLCFPGFNCYACPLALYACPIGSLQTSVARFSFGMFLYVVGFVGLIGAAVGRLMCGWICPFGFLQDLLYKIPSPKLSLPRWTRFGKYAALVVLVLLIPIITHVNWFSRLCPAGALEGTVPLKLLPPASTTLAFGWFFWLKMGILVFFLVWMVFSSRPFCRTACPLGAMWALLAPVSLYRMRVDRTACTRCGKCEEVCTLDVNICEDPNSPECIRCLDCKKVCPEGAISSGFARPSEEAQQLVAH